jgi:hypothetical protein
MRKRIKDHGFVTLRQLLLNWMNRTRRLFPGPSRQRHFGIAFIGRENYKKYLIIKELN